MLALSESYVEEHITSVESRGVKVTCPECGGKNCWVTYDNGRGFCFNCGIAFQLNGKPLYQRNDIMYDVDSLRAYYRNITEFYQECLIEEHKEYLKRRGIDNYEDYGFGYCPNNASSMYRSQVAKDSGAVSYDGSPSLGNRIVFPYIIDDQVTDIRGRAIGDTTPKYKSLRHASRSRGAIYPYNYTRAMEKARTTKTLIITEGEIKAAVADIHGFACVALPGMLSWKPGLMIQSDITPIVIFDSSPSKEDKLRVDKAIASLAKHILNLKVATLPLLNQDKMDIDAYLLHRRGGAKRFQHIIDGAVDYQDYKGLRRF